MRWVDISMPKLDGYDTCGVIRAQTWALGVRLVAITGPSRRKCANGRNRRESTPTCQSLSNSRISAESLFHPSKLPDGSARRNPEARRLIQHDSCCMKNTPLVILCATAIFTGLGFAQQNNPSQPGPSTGGPAANRPDGTGASQDGSRPAAPGIPSGAQPAPTAASSGPTPSMKPIPDASVAPLPTPAISPAPKPSISPAPLPTPLLVNPLVAPTSMSATNTHRR